MSVTSANRFLSEAEMQGNALYIYNYFTAQGWTVNAIAAILANMQVESTINPAIYEGLDSSSDTNGYGLVQWTPNTKYKTWADANGYNYGDINGQLARIMYELNEGIQWYATDAYPLSFAEFSLSTADVGELAYAFMYNYERPATLDQPIRKTHAATWLSFLQENGGTGGEGGDVTEEGVTVKHRHKMRKLLLYYTATRR